MNYKIFVINLDERPDKFKNAEDQLIAQQFTCERISAIRGSNLSEDEVQSSYDSTLNKQKYMKSLSLGEIGCYLSHRAAWQKIVDEKLDFAIILEDDCKLETTFKDVPQAISKLRNWDYIKLTGPRGKKKIQERLSISNGFSIAHYNKVPISTPGQVVSLKGAQALLKHSKPFFRPVDVDLQQYWEKGVDIIGLEPKQVDTAGFDSDITAMAKSSGRTDKSSLGPRVKFRLMSAIKNAASNGKRPDLSHYIK